MIINLAAIRDTECNAIPVTPRLECPINLIVPPKIVLTNRPIVTAIFPCFMVNQTPLEHSRSTWEMIVLVFQKEDEDQELPPDEAKDIRKIKSDL